MLVSLGALRDHLKAWWRPGGFELGRDWLAFRIPACGLCLLDELEDPVELGCSNIEKAKPRFTACEADIAR